MKLRQECYEQYRLNLIQIQTLWEYCICHFHICIKKGSKILVIFITRKFGEFLTDITKMQIITILELSINRANSKRKKFNELYSN